MSSRYCVLSLTELGLVLMQVRKYTRMHSRPCWGNPGARSPRHMYVLSKPSQCESQSQSCICHSGSCSRPPDDEYQGFGESNKAMTPAVMNRRESDSVKALALGVMVGPMISVPWWNERSCYGSRVWISAFHSPPSDHFHTLFE